MMIQNMHFIGAEHTYKFDQKADFATHVGGFIFPNQITPIA